MKWVRHRVFSSSAASRAHEHRGRKKHYREFYLRLSDEAAGVQGRRAAWIAACRSACRDARSTTSSRTGTTCLPADWKTAIEVLHSTNNFPEFTAASAGPCEEACVLRINEDRSASSRSSMQS